MNICLQLSSSWDFDSVPSNNFYLKDFFVFFNGEKELEGSMGKRKEKVEERYKKKNKIMGIL